LFVEKQTYDNIKFVEVCSYTFQ